MNRDEATIEHCKESRRQACDSSQGKVPPSVSKLVPCVDKTRDKIYAAVLTPLEANASLGIL